MAQEQPQSRMVTPRRLSRDGTGGRWPAGAASLGKPPHARGGVALRGQVGTPLAPMRPAPSSPPAPPLRARETWPARLARCPDTTSPPEAQGRPVEPQETRPVYNSGKRASAFHGTPAPPQRPPRRRGSPERRDLGARLVANGSQKPELALTFDAPRRSSLPPVSRRAHRHGRLARPEPQAVAEGPQPPHGSRDAPSRRGRPRSGAPRRQARSRLRGVAGRHASARPSMPGGARRGDQRRHGKVVPSGALGEFGRVH